MEDKRISQDLNNYNHLITQRPAATYTRDVWYDSGLHFSRERSATPYENNAATPSTVESLSAQSNSSGSVQESLQDYFQNNLRILSPHNFCVMRENKRKRNDRTPSPSKEVFASEDNIVAGVSFDRNNETRVSFTEKKKKLEETNKTDNLTEIEPVAIIDLTKLTPSPTDFIELSDSENEEQVTSSVNDYTTCLKTSPKSQVRSTSTEKGIKMRAITNLLRDPNYIELEDDTQENVSGLHKEPNTLPEHSDFYPKAPDACYNLPTLESMPTIHTPSTINIHVQQADSQNSIEITPKSSLSKSLERSASTSLQTQTITVTKPMTQTISFLSLTPNFLMTSTPVNTSVTSPQIDINITVLAPSSSNPQRIVLSNAVNSSSVESSPRRATINSTPNKKMLPETSRKSNQSQNTSVEQNSSSDSSYSLELYDYKGHFEPPVKTAPKPPTNTADKKNFGSLLDPRTVLPNSVKSSSVESSSRRATIYSTPNKPMLSETSKKLNQSQNRSDSAEQNLSSDSSYLSGLNNYKNYFEPPVETAPTNMVHKINLKSPFNTRTVVPKTVKSNPVEYSPKKATINSTPSKPILSETSSQSNQSQNRNNNSEQNLRFVSFYSPGFNDYKSHFDLPVETASKPPTNTAHKKNFGSPLDPRTVLPKTVNSGPVESLPRNATPFKPMLSETSRKSNESQNRNDSAEIDLIFDSSYSPVLNFDRNYFEPPVETEPAPPTNTAHNINFGSLSNQITPRQDELASNFNNKPVAAADNNGIQQVRVIQDEGNIKILDKLPNFAAEMEAKHKFMMKLNRQERVAAEAIVVLTPYYNNKDINKEEYKYILRKAVPMICHVKSEEIDPAKIKNFIEAYVEKVTHTKKINSSLQQ